MNMQPRCNSFINRFVHLSPQGIKQEGQNNRNYCYKKNMHIHSIQSILIVMYFLYPLISVLSESIAKTIDKANYNKNKIKPRELLFLLFLTMSAGTGVSLLFIDQTFPALSLSVVALLTLVIVISFGQNFFDYVGLSTKNLSLREPIINLQPIFASFLAYILFPSERNIKYIVAIILGVAIMYIGSSRRKFKLTLDKGILYLFTGTVCSAILVNIYKLGLETIPALYLLLFRTAGVLLLLRLFFRPNLKSLTSNQVGLGVGSGLIYIAGNLGQLYSIQYLGLNLTILLLMIGPGVIYLASSLVLKEKVQYRQVATSAALLTVIIWATYL
jgi:drug/metabolite transporter (DMT)-like permease